MPKLTDPIRIAGITIKNRLWAGPLNINSCDWWGFPTVNALRVYEERARGGFGLVVVEGATFPPQAGNAAALIKAYHPKHANALNRLVEVLHRWGATAIMQLAPVGRQAFPWPSDPVWKPEELIPLAPSATTPAPPGFTPPKEMGPEDIEAVYQQMEGAVAICQRAHFDGVLLHASHGFLLQQFMSPWTNHRTDKYGLQEGKILFCTEMIERVKKAAGPGFIVGVRLAATDGLDDATKMFSPAATPEKQLTIDQVKNYARQMEEAGADYLDITAGVLETVHKFIPPLYSPRGFYLAWAEEIKKNVNIPVISGGKIYDRGLAEKIVEQGRLDAVFLGRMALSDPDSPRKFFANREKDVRKCITCCYCMQRFVEGNEVGCAINPDLHSYRPPPLKKTSQPQKIMVVGGGVAGMEVARLASLAGHRVALYEKNAELGGTVQKVAYTPRLYMRDLSNILTWQKNQLQKLKVDVHLEEEVTADTVERAKPDVLVLAAGSYFDRSNIQGADKTNVLELGEYLSNRESAGEKVAILGSRGAEIAVSLARQGKKVTLLEEGSDAMIHAIPWIVPLTMRSMVLLDFILKEPNLTFQANVRVKEISEKGMIFADSNGQEQNLEVDTVILAANHQPRKGLKAAVEGKVNRVYEVGDCVTPGTIKDAIHAAHVLVRDELEREY